MPYMVTDSGVEGVDSRFCVHKQGPDKKPIGKPLGCHPSRAEADKQMAALYANMPASEKPKGSVQFTDHIWEVKADVSGADWKLHVIGLPFGGPYAGKDADGEFFSAKTDIMMNVGETRPVVYFHGFTPGQTKQGRPEVIGVARLTAKTAKGWEWDVVLDKTKQLAKRIWDAARKGIVRASSGAVAHLVRVAKQTGEILTWPVGELSLIDEGVGREASNPWATAIPIKSVFDEAGMELPEAFAEGVEPKADASEELKASEQKVQAEPLKPDNAPMYAAIAAAAYATLKGKEKLSDG